jgi:hypothetical protein
MITHREAGAAFARVARSEFVLARRVVAADVRERTADADGAAETLLGLAPPPSQTGVVTADVLVGQDGYARRFGWPLNGWGQTEVARIRYRNSLKMKRMMAIQRRRAVRFGAAPALAGLG